MVKNISKSVFIVGIGGVSMSAIALELKKHGHTIYGSDETKSNITNELEKQGIKVFIGHTKSNWNNECGTLIYSSAISLSNPELKQAKESGAIIMTRKEALYEISELYNNVICVAGSHGKTTTTSIISYLFDKACVNFSAHIGGVPINFGSNYVDHSYNKNDNLVLEACEYKDNFLSLKPTIAVITNISYDHVDYFNSEQDILNSFIAFSNRVKAGGLLIANLDDKLSKILLKKTIKNKQIVTISLLNPKADFYLKVKEDNFKDFCCGSVFYKGKKLIDIKTSLEGRHNFYNILISLAVCDHIGVNLSQVQESLMDFKGVKRRNELVGQINGADVVFDYAHHPQEIDKMIELKKKHLKGKLFVVFQPHTFTRTKVFWSNFIHSLSRADKLILYPIYKARENCLPGVTSYRMAKDLRALGRSAYYAQTLECIYNYLGYFVCKDDLVLVLGAGDIDALRNLIEIRKV